MYGARKCRRQVQVLSDRYFPGALHLGLHRYARSLLDGNLGRNAGITPWTVFNDMRVAKKIYFGERFNLDLIADMFNIANVYNVAAVSPLFTNAGQATAAYDPRQFQFALKLNW